MLEALLNKGVEPIADIVINHRDGPEGGTIFQNPDWGSDTIVSNDEAFGEPKNKHLPKGAEEERPLYLPTRKNTEGYDSARDIDHTKTQVRRDIIRYLRQLQSMGYRGWRYDMVHGYLATRIATYNRATRPTFCVGEYDWGNQDEQRGWVWNTATVVGDIKTASCVFDFKTFFKLKYNHTNYSNWYGGSGLICDTKDNIPWKNKAVTFLENHDTGYRTDHNGKPQAHHEFDSFANNWEVQQGYAYILTHPGIPTVYWKHYFDWGDDLQGKIKALINARKIAGVHSGSKLTTQENARQRGIYAAAIDGRYGHIYVRIGGSDADWQPFNSNYKDYREYAAGDGWKVWVKRQGNPPVQQAPRKQPFPIPTYTDPKYIFVQDSEL